VNIKEKGEKWGERNILAKKGRVLPQSARRAEKTYSTNTRGIGEFRFHRTV